MARTNYSWEKRQRELEKQKKKEEKLQKKRAEKAEKKGISPEPDEEKNE
jgi:hypothetical protein